jgi:hypothetical protein
MIRSPRAARVLTLTAIAEFIWLWGFIGSQDAIGADLVFFRSIAQHWLDTGQFYLEHQLAGPYAVQTLVDVLYPPTALLLFVPFIWLPSLVWWIIPIGVFCVAILGLRPARWTWPLIAAGIAYPLTVSQVIYGNTNMWVAAAIAAGVRWGWPSVLVLLKPSLAPFAVVGAGRRSWWIALAILLLVSLLFGSLWLDYATAMRNSSLSWMYGLLTLPLMLVPLVAWLGRREGGTEREAGSANSRLQPDPSAERSPDVDHVTIT